MVCKTVCASTPRFESERRVQVHQRSPCPVRLRVRSAGFQPAQTGSTPVRGTRANQPRRSAVLKAREGFQNFGSRPHVVGEIDRGDTAQSRETCLPRRQIDSPRAIRPVKHASSPRPRKGRLAYQLGGAESGRERLAKDEGSTARSNAGNRGLRTGNGWCRPARQTSSPSNSGKGSAHSPSLASKGGVQIDWSVATARWTRVGKIGQVVRGTNDTAACGISASKRDRNHWKRTSQQVAVSSVGRASDL